MRAFRRGGASLNTEWLRREFKKRELMGKEVDNNDFRSTEALLKNEGLMASELISATLLKI